MGQNQRGQRLRLGLWNLVLSSASRNHSKIITRSQNRKHIRQERKKDKGEKKKEIDGWMIERMKE